MVGSAPSTGVASALVRRPDSCRSAPARPSARAARGGRAAASPAGPGPAARGSGRRSSRRARGLSGGSSGPSARTRATMGRGAAAGARVVSATTIPSAWRRPNSTSTASPGLEVGQLVRHRVGVRLRPAAGGVDRDLDEPTGGPLGRPVRPGFLEAKGHWFALTASEASGGPGVTGGPGGMGGGDARRR